VRRPVVIAVVAVVAALLGGALGAALVRAADSGDESASKTVVVQPPPAGPSTPPAPSASAPLPKTRFDPARLYSERSPGVVTIYSYFGDPTSTGGQASQGSGFVVSPKGYILTNAHVITTAPSAEVSTARTLFVEFQDGDRAPARVIGYDLFSDVGLIKTDPANHAIAPVPLGDSARVVVGEPVAAIGSPFGNQNSLTVGVVSGTGRSISSLTSDYDVADAIQVDAPINRGNSGGPLFNAAGEVIGLNAQIRSETGINEGVGFAVPINVAKRAMRDLLAGGQVRYAYVGVSTQDLTPGIARLLGYSAQYGALVACVEDGGPGDRAGLRGGSNERFVLGRPGVVEGGDVIVAINGAPVRSGTELVRIVSEVLRPGRSAVLTVVRGQGRQRLTVRLAERPTEPSAACSP
jgi:S1-C subfamily serine protease